MVEAAVVGRLGALEMLAGRVVLLVAVPVVVLVRVAEEAVGFVAVEVVPVAVRRAVVVVPVVPVVVRFAAVVGDLGLAVLGDAAVGFAPASASASASASALALALASSSASASAVPLVDGSSPGGGDGALTDWSASSWAGSG